MKITKKIIFLKFVNKNYTEILEHFLKLQRIFENKNKIFNFLNIFQKE